MFAMGGPVRMENGGIASLDENPNFRPDASELEMRAMAQFLSENSGYKMVSPKEMFGQLLDLSNQELRRLKDTLPNEAFTGFQPRPDQTIEEMIEENERNFYQNQIDQQKRTEASNKAFSEKMELMRKEQEELNRKSFVESQPEGSLKGTFFDYIPDAYQMSDYLRQFFTKEPKGMAAGGAAFPDLTGDGQVTQADILKGRGVQLAMGGEPMMAQQAAMMQAPMPQAPMPQDPSMDQAMAQAAQVGVDPAAVEGMLSQVSEGIGNLDEAEDFEQVMNSMRGDEAPISERYAELAEVVGEEDAQATPESVLALVQPVMQIAQVDQGIGGLAQEEMSAPVEGNMAGGIMSTVNMGEEVPAPVNFNQGGPVVALANGGNPYYQEALDLRRSVLSPESQQQAFEDQKKMTQAQMLFDIAQGALAFATPGDRQMSAAERLAQVAQPVAGSIGARAGELQKFKQGQEAEDRALKLSAITAAETQLAAQKEREFKASETALNRAFELTKQSNQFDFQNKSQKSDQDFRMDLLDREADIAIAAAAIANDNSQEGIKLRAKLEKEAIQLQSTLRRHEISMNLQNDIKKMGVANKYDLEKMEKGKDYDIELANHRAGLEEVAQQKAMEHDIAMFALKDIADKEKMVTAQEFELIVQQNAQNFTSDQNAITRSVEAARFAQELAFKTSEDQRADKLLTIREREQLVDEAYKAGKLAIDQAAANAIDLGSPADTAAIKVITSKANLEGYANGTLGDNKAQYEQALLNYVNKGSLSWDNEKGRYVKSKVNLAPDVLSALKKGDPAFYEIISGQIVQPGDTKSGGGGAGGGESPAVTKDALTQLDTSLDNYENINLAKLSKNIMLPDGRVNLDSPIWDEAKTNIYDSKVNYPVAIGFSRVLPGVTKGFAEGLEEIGVGEGTGAEGQNLAQATADLQLMATKLLQFTMNENQDRVVKFVQLEIAELSEGMKPGGFFLKNDAKARATISSLEKLLANAIQLESSLLTEFGGDSAAYSEKQVQSARKNVKQALILLNEIKGFKRGFGGLDSDTEMSSISKTVTGTEAAVNFLDSLILPPAEATN